MHEPIHNSPDEESCADDHKSPRWDENLDPFIRPFSGVRWTRNLHCVRWPSEKEKEETTAKGGGERHRYVGNLSSYLVLENSCSHTWYVEMQNRQSGTDHGYDH